MSFLCNVPLFFFLLCVFFFGGTLSTRGLCISSQTFFLCAFVFPPAPPFSEKWRGEKKKKNSVSGIHETRDRRGKAAWNSHEKKKRGVCTSSIFQKKKKV